MCVAVSLGVWGDSLAGRVFEVGGAIGRFGRSGSPMVGACGCRGSDCTSGERVVLEERIVVAASSSCGIVFHE